MFRQKREKCGNPSGSPFLLLLSRERRIRLFSGRGVAEIACGFLGFGWAAALLFCYFRMTCFQRAGRRGRRLRI